MPSGVELRREGSQTNENRRMLAAFRWNLRILSYVALVVGSFLIYNTISVSVVRRRAEIGIVRALGATRGAVMTAFLGEAVCFGVAGGVLGIFLGRVMASGAVKLLGATVDALVRQQPAGADRAHVEHGRAGTVHRGGRVAGFGSGSGARSFAGLAS